MATLTYTGQLQVTSCWCGIRLAIPSDLFAMAKRHEGHTVFCPLGHKFVYSNTTEEQLAEERRLRRSAEQRAAARLELLRQEERSHAATRGHVTRKKKQLERVKNGVCPCCNRSFQNLARHMESKHPEYQA
jgi:hypothetical protein